MCVWDGVLGALGEAGGWPALYLLASYLQATEASERPRWALHVLQAVLSDAQLQTPPILADLESRSDEYRGEASLLMEQGKPLQIGLHVPWIVLSTILCLEANLWAARDHSNQVGQEACYTTISKALSFAAVSFRYTHDHLHDGASDVVEGEDEFVDVAIWISNLMLYLSESLLKLSCCRRDCAELYIGALDHQSKAMDQEALQGPREADCDSQNKEITVTQLSEVSFLDLLARCKDLYTIAETLRDLILARLRDIQLDSPLACQLVTHLFWAPEQSFEDGVRNAKEIYKRLQGLTAVSLSQTSTSDGNFVSPEHLQQECSNHAAYYNSDQLVAARMTCLKVLQLLEVAPVLSARPTSVKRLQRLFLSSLRVLEGHNCQEPADLVLKQREAPSILAEIAGTHVRHLPQLVPCLRFAFYRAVLNYYCSTPQSDLRDVILYNLESTLAQGTNKIEDTDIATVLSSVSEYADVLLKTVDTCIRNVCMGDREDGCPAVWRADVGMELAGYTDSLYGLLLCLPCRSDPLSDLISLTGSMVSLCYHYEDIRLQSPKHVAMFTQNLLFNLGTQKLKKLFSKLMNLYTLLLALEYPLSYLETDCFQEHVSQLLLGKLRGEPRLDHKFAAKKAIQQAKTLLLSQFCADEPGFSFAALAKNVSFTLPNNTDDASLQENLQCILFYLMMDTPICLLDYITTAQIVHNLQVELAAKNNLEILLSASKGLFAHVDQNIALNRFRNIGDEVQSKLRAAYSELLLTFVLCYEVFS